MAIASDHGADLFVAVCTSTVVGGKQSVGNKCQSRARFQPSGARSMAQANEPTAHRSRLGAATRLKRARAWPMVGVLGCLRPSPVEHGHLHGTEFRQEVLDHCRSAKQFRAGTKKQVRRETLAINHLCPGRAVAAGRGHGATLRYQTVAVVRPAQAFPHRIPGDARTSRHPFDARPAA